jgi:hypothetical protein
VSRGWKVKRHACSVIGTRQYRRMESSCASAPLAREPENIRAAGKARSMKPTLLTCSKHLRQLRGGKLSRKEMAENMGTRETNVSEKEIAAARRGGEPQTSAVQPRRQEAAIAAEHQAAGESSSPSQEGTVAKDILRPVCQDSGAGGKMEEDRDRSDTAETIRAETPPTNPATGDRTTCRTNCLRRQLIRLLKGGSEYFTPEEVRRIIRAA